MGQSRVQRLLEASGLSEDEAPNLEEWRAFLERIKQERLTEALQRRERYLGSIVEMQRRLLGTKTHELGAFNHVLEPLARASGASRIYLFENHVDEERGLLMSQRAEWCAPGISPELENPDLQNLSYDELFPRWAHEMREGRPINGIVRDFPESERELLESQDILSILVIPFEVEGEFLGFVGFDHCVETRVWDEIEVRLLSAAAGNIGLMLDQRRTSMLLERANDALQAARDQALDASRAKSEFLAKVSHELRTPLTGVIGYAELVLEMLEYDEFDPTWRRDIEQILRAGNHLLSVITDLLDLSRVEAGQLRVAEEDVDMDVLMLDISRMIEPMKTQRGNELSCEFEPLGSIRSDGTRLRQILLNLASNAFKYTKDGTVWLRARASQDAITFEIEDTGIGMTSEQQEDMFEAFVQADNSHTRVFEGTGLGLTITRHLCDALGATLAVESHPGQGSTFTVTVPREHKPQHMERLSLFH